jgi:hypothetical protein
VIVIVLIGVPVGVLAGDEVVPELLALLVALLLELLPHAASATATTSPAAITTSERWRRRAGAPLLSRLCICSLLMRV